MKKLIAIAVVFALVMGGVFAETSVSGFAVGRVVLGSGETGKDTMTKGEGSARIKVSGKNEDGTFGGEFRFDGSTWWGSGSFLRDGRANAWWKPIDILKIQLGPGLDGSFGIGNAGTGWGFYSGANDLDIWNYAGFNGDTFGQYNGNGSLGLLLSVYPISNLEVNMVVPFSGDQKVLDVYQKIYAEVAYKIDGIGKVVLGYKSDTGALSKGLRVPAADQTAYNNALDDAFNSWRSNGGAYDPPAAIAPTQPYINKNNPTKIGFSFDLSALSGMGLNMALALNTGLPTANTDQFLKRTHPLYAQFGAGFTAADFNVKFRFIGQFLGKTTTTTASAETVEKDPAFIILGLFPNYKVSGNLFVGFGFDVKVAGIDDDDATPNTITWHSSPFVQYQAGPGKFQVGLNVGNKTGEKDKLQWDIPLRIGFDF